MQESEQSEIETEVPETKQESGYIDFDQLPEEHRDKVRTRIDADFRKNKEYERQLKAEKERTRKMEQELLELRKPREVQRPSEDLWISDPEQAQKQLDQYENSIRDSQKWEYEKQQQEASWKQESEKERFERIENVRQRATAAGIDSQKLAYAAMVVDRTLPQDLQGFLVGHEYAPQLINRLAENPVELQELASLSPIEAGVKLDRMASAYAPKRQSSAPPPDDTLKGGPASDNPYGSLLKGSTIS